MPVFNVVKRWWKFPQQEEKDKGFEGKKEWKTEEKVEKMEVKLNLTGCHCKAEMTTHVPGHCGRYHSPVGRSLWELQNWLAYVNKVQLLMALHNESHNES